jgi:hypothetical protein
MPKKFFIVGKTLFNLDHVSGAELTEDGGIILHMAGGFHPHYAGKEAEDLKAFLGTTANAQDAPEPTVEGSVGTIEVRRPQEPLSEAEINAIEQKSAYPELFAAGLLPFQLTKNEQAVDEDPPKQKREAEN